MNNARFTPSLPRGSRFIGVFNLREMLYDNYKTRFAPATKATRRNYRTIEREERGCAFQSESAPMPDKFLAKISRNLRAARATMIV